MFLLGLRSFVNEMEYRRDVWKWMKAKWGSYVSFPVESYSDSVLVCTDKDASPSLVVSLDYHRSDRPKFLLTWVIQFSPEGIVVPVIRPFFDIQMKGGNMRWCFPIEDAKQSECDQLIRSILSVFDELIHVRSVEDAICFLMECILWTVCVEQLTPHTRCQEKKKLDETGSDPVTYPLRRDHSTI